MWRKRRTVASLALAGALGVAIVIVLVARGASGAGPTESLPAGATLLSVEPRTTSEPLPPGFLGLSIEYWAFENYAGKDPHAVDPVFVQLVRSLTPGQTAVLRLGGVTTDRTWWPVPGVARPAGAIYTLTPRRLAVAKAVAEQTSARLILGVQFEADSKIDAAAEARAMLNEIGPSRIDAFELGNEPELYGSWAWYRTAQGHSVRGRAAGYDVATFTKDYDNIATSMAAFPLAGPATGANGWRDGLSAFISSQPRLRVLTVHRYPLQACYFPTGSPRYPTIARLLAPSSSVGLAQSVIPFLTIAHAHHVELRIDEMNNISCGSAPGVTNSFGMALWALDALFADFQVGVDGVNIHTYPGADYQLFSFTRSGGGWRATVEPEYYGLLMFAQAAPPGSRLLQVAGLSHSNGLRAWATRAPDGKFRLVLINVDTAHARTVAVRVAGAGAAATLERLQAPDVHASDGVTLGGQSFGRETATGALTGDPHVATLSPTGGAYIVRLPAASAAMLTTR